MGVFADGGKRVQLMPRAHAHDAVRVLILMCVLPAVDPSCANLRCFALHRSRPAPVFDPRVRTMAANHKTGESFENKSQSDDVRRNNIIAAKGARQSPARERAGCGEHAGSSVGAPRDVSNEATGCRISVAVLACGVWDFDFAELPACLLRCMLSQPQLRAPCASASWTVGAPFMC